MRVTFKHSARSGAIILLLGLGACIRLGFEGTPEAIDAAIDVSSRVDVDETDSSDAEPEQDAAADDGPAVADIPDTDAGLPCELGDCPPSPHPCMMNLCVEGVCIEAGLPDGTDCGSELACATGQCHSGECVEDGTFDCADGNLCTEDHCVIGQGCFHVPKDCDDGSSCTLDICLGITGECVYPSLPKCFCDDVGDCPKSDSPNCSKLKCKAGECVEEPKNEPKNCDDGDPCTVDDSCQGVTCKGSPKCEGGVGSCVEQFCSAGECLSGTVACDDANFCTVDFCDEGQCVHENAGPALCDDGSPCTVDTCSPEYGCAYTSIDNPAEEPGCACTSDDECLEVLVETPCRSPACVESTCQWVAKPEGTSCLGEQLCGSTGSCFFGSCEEGTLCDDGNPCTDDVCLGGPSDDFCLHNSACDDGNKCTEDSCTAQGSCINDEIICEDGAFCTYSVCLPVTGTCAHLTTFCSYCEKDGDCLNACAEAVCDLGSHECVPVDEPDCPEKKCKENAGCTPVVGCQYENAPPGQSCGNDKECNGFGQCVED